MPIPASVRPPGAAIQVSDGIPQCTKEQHATDFSALVAVRRTEDGEGSAEAQHPPHPPRPAQSCPGPGEERQLCRRASRGPEARHGRGRGEETASIRTLSGLTQSPCTAEAAEATHGGAGLPAGARAEGAARRRRGSSGRSSAGTAIGRPPGSVGGTKDASGTDTERQKPVRAPRQTFF